MSINFGNLVYFYILRNKERYKSANMRNELMIDLKLIWILFFIHLMDVYIVGMEVRNVGCS